MRAVVASLLCLCALSRAASRFVHSHESQLELTEACVTVVQQQHQTIAKSASSTDPSDAVTKWPVYERWSISPLEATRPSIVVQDWQLRGHVVLDEPDLATFEPVAQYNRPRTSGQVTTGSIDELDQASMVVQIGIDATGNGGDGGARPADLSSMHFVQKRACQLATSSTGKVHEVLDLWMHDNTATDASPSVQGIAYIIRNSEGESACSTVTAFTIGNGHELTVRIKRSTELELGPPPSVDQAQNVRVDADGKVLPPPAQKSFIQKYWMYIVPVLLLLMLSPPEEQQKGGGKQ
ncbi:hypothetical protein ACM66B_000555 [Microbotryomycetes sp. NB124-2]